MSEHYPMERLIFRIMLKSRQNDDIMVSEEAIEEALYKAFPDKDFFIKVKEVDHCEECGGVNGGVPGNENIVGGKVICDYCHAKHLRNGYD